MTAEPFQALVERLLSTNSSRYSTGRGGCKTQTWALSANYMNKDNGISDIPKGASVVTPPRNADISLSVSLVTKLSPGEDVSVGRRHHLIFKS